MKETDYLIIGAGAMGMAFADEIISEDATATITLVDRRSRAGGHWINAYPFVGLHQPAAFYGVNSLNLGNGTTDLSSKTEILEYYDQIIQKFESSNRVEFLAEHNYKGDGKVEDLNNPGSLKQYKTNKRLVDATYMNVEVPSTHAPKYKIDEGVTIVPINNLVEEQGRWENYFVIGAGKTGMDAVLYLLNQDVPAEQIHWVISQDSWMFDRSKIQVGNVANAVLQHAAEIKNAKQADDVFLNMEKMGGILRLDESIIPTQWKCATVSAEELAQLRKVKNTIREGRVSHITSSEIQLKETTLTYSGRTLFVDCSANGLAKKDIEPIFSNQKITLQPVLFCQQVFSAALIAKMELVNSSDTKRNKLIPVPHPEKKEDWPSALAVSVQNLLAVHRVFPMWMFQSRLNFMSHEPMWKYIMYAVKVGLANPGLQSGARRLDSLRSN